MAAPSATHYNHVGGYDEAQFLIEAERQFKGSGRWNPQALPQLSVLLKAIAADRELNDVRSAAYILATVFWETTTPQQVTRQLFNKKGAPLRDKKGNPVVVTERRWLMSMAPVNEVGRGAGRRYHEPVKVKSMPDGSARITEQDGDSFTVSATGVVMPLTRKARMGSADGGPVSQAYLDDDGQEHAYFGRGYVQLTWWSNYAKAGVAVGRGLDLLLDPELVKDPAIAYELMSHGMRTGEGFANGHRLSDYFHGSHTDYVGARRMVNGQDHAADIAAIAQKFERALMAARLRPSPVPVAPARPALAMPMP